MSFRLPLAQIVLLAYASAFLFCASSLASAAELNPRATKAGIPGILYNEDDSEVYFTVPRGTMKASDLDRVVDDLANSSVTAMLICCNAQNVNYPSKVWDMESQGYDPTKDDSQPFFGDVSSATQRADWQHFAHNLQLLLNAGIDPTQRMIDRCREKNISPWLSLRMNDVHDAEYLKSPLHSRFWIDHHEYWRYPDRSGYLNRCLNYGLKPVRDHMMALIQEVCDRFDVDGIELDWNRFPAHFREGEEATQSIVLTNWMKEVREVVANAEKKRGHPILIAARVPARPETSLGMGLDAVTWAKQGLIDHLIVAPFYTTDTDIPVEQWIDRLKGTNVGVTAGLEESIHAYHEAPAIPNTPERRRGAAISALSRGSQGIYLFNYFSIPKSTPDLLHEMSSIEKLATKDRSYLVTYSDINVPGRRAVSALPKILKPKESADFKLYIGPKPLAVAQGAVNLTLVPESPEQKCESKVMLNKHDPESAEQMRFNSAAFQEAYNTVTVKNVGSVPFKIDSVELSLKFPDADNITKDQNK